MKTVAKGGWKGRGKEGGGAHEFFSSGAASDAERGGWPRKVVVVVVGRRMNIVWRTMAAAPTRSTGKTQKLNTFHTLNSISGNWYLVYCI